MNLFSNMRQSFDLQEIFFKPKYYPGQIVVYSDEGGQRDLMQIHTAFKRIKNEEGTIAIRQYYSGIIWDLVQTSSSDIPLAPKFATGISRVPEERISPLEALFVSS